MMMKRTYNNNLRLFITLLLFATTPLRLNVVLLVLVQGRMEAAVIVPHGDFVLKPSLIPFLNTTIHQRMAAEELARAARDASHWWNYQVKPDLILLSTPHGIALSRDWAVYLGTHASGSVPLGQDLIHNNNSNNSDDTSPSTIALEDIVSLDPILLEPDLSQQLVDRASALGHNFVQGVLVTNDLLDNVAGMPLHWAEVIPLLVMKPNETVAPPPPPLPPSPYPVDDKYQHHQTSSSRSSSSFDSTRDHQQRRHIIVSHPLRRYEQAGTVTMVQELLQLGRFLRNWMDTREETIGVLISSDLSHTHLANGPYGFSNTSALFDTAIGDWAADPCHRASYLLEEARLLQPAAKSCGYTGLVLLHGILCLDGDDKTKNSEQQQQGRVVEDEVEKKKKDGDGEQESSYEHQWQADVLFNHNVTYYGMMVANFSRTTMTTTTATTTATAL